MSRNLISSLLVVTLAFGTAYRTCGALDLSATSEEYVSSGILYKRLLFRDNQRTVEMELPSGWNYRGSVARLQLIPPGSGFAEATIKTEPLPVPSALDEATAASIGNQILNSLPPGSQGATLLQTQKNPGGPGGGASLEVIVSYKALGHTFWKSTLLVNLPDSRLVLQLTAPEAEFPALSLNFRRAIQSWEWKQPAAATKNEQVIASVPAPQKPSITN
jgi:hypothetical protein